MMHNHPPNEQLREIFGEQTSKSAPKPNEFHQACWGTPEADALKRKLTTLAFIVFFITAALVGLNAYQREQAEREEDALNSGGTGAAHATETTFPEKSPIIRTPVYYMQPASNQVLVPIQTVRPGEPTAPYMALPVDDGSGHIRLKRFVGR